MGGIPNNTTLIFRFITKTNALRFVSRTQYVIQVGPRIILYQAYLGSVGTSDENSIYNVACIISMYKFIFELIIQSTCFELKIFLFYWIIICYDHCSCDSCKNGR